MFKKLHLQMTWFCALITGIILIVFSFFCLIISENGLKKNTETLFYNELSTMIIHLQSQEYIALQWINQMQGNNHYKLYLYDSGVPLFSQKLYSDENDEELVQKAQTYARNYGINISSSGSQIIPSHTEFAISDESGRNYYASAGIVPKDGSSIGFIVLYSLGSQQKQIIFQRLLFTAADTAAIALLILFSWFFTKRMLKPLEENRKNQIQFISAASHELRAPLTVMLSGTEALQKTEVTSEQEHFIHIIQAEGLRMQHLISDMLLLARSESGSFSVTAIPCQPDILLMDAFEKYEFSAKKKNISLSLSLPDEQTCSCLCDPERISQVFSILLDNALSYTPQGGRITLTLSSVSGPFIKFCIADTGPGIPDTEKKSIFDRFYRMESSHTDKNHFGLGLSIAREIILSHHGHIWITDSLGGGACFVLELPTVS